MNMLRMVMAKFRGEYVEVLDAAIEGLVTSSGTVLELLDYWCVSGVPNGAHRVLVDTVGNHFLSLRNLALESVWCFEHGKVMHASWLRTPHPGKLALMNQDPKFIAKARSIALVRKPFGTWILTWLVDFTMHCICREEQHCRTSSAPNNLQEEKSFKSKSVCQ